MDNNNSSQEAIDNLSKLGIEYSQGNLTYYSQEGNNKIVKLLLDAGLNPNRIVVKKINKKDEQFLALHNAIINGHLDTAKLLIEYGADLNYHDNNFSKPINIAIKNNNIEILKLLIEKGSEIEKGDEKDSNIPIIQAIQLKNVSIVKILAPLVNLNVISSPSWSKVTPLTMAIEVGDLEIVKILIENGADINFAANSNHETPLIIATKNKNTEIVKLLIEKGAEINRARKNGNTALFIAHQRKYEAIKSILIENGANPLTEHELLNSRTFKSIIQNKIESAIDYTKRSTWPKIAIAAFAVLVIIRGCAGLLTDINDDEAVVDRMQGTWVVQQKSGGYFFNIKLKIEGKRFVAWRYMSLTEGDDDNWGTAVCEGEFELGPVQTYNNASSEFRHISWNGCVDIHDAFYDDTHGLYWGEWGPFEND